MIIMSISNYLIVVNDCPKYRGCFACNYFLVNNDYLVCTVSSCTGNFVYNDSVDYNCVLVSTIVLIKMTVYTTLTVLFTLTV